MRTNHIERYFLRSCAKAKLDDQKSGRLSDPIREGVLQTALIVSLIFGGAISTVLAMRPPLPSIVERLFATYGSAPAVIAGLLLFALAYGLARRIAARFRNQPEILEYFNSPSDRRMINIQFFVVLAMAGGMPFGAYFFLRSH